MERSKSKVPSDISDHMKEVINRILSEPAFNVREALTEIPNPFQAWEENDAPLSMRERERIKNWVYQQTKELKNDS